MIDTPRFYRIEDDADSRAITHASATVRRAVAQMYETWREANETEAVDWVQIALLLEASRAKLGVHALTFVSTSENEDGDDVVFWRLEGEHNIGHMTIEGPASLLLEQLARWAGVE